MPNSRRSRQRIYLTFNPVNSTQKICYQKQKMIRLLFLLALTATLLTPTLALTMADMYDVATIDDMSIYANWADNPKDKPKNQPQSKAKPKTSPNNNKGGNKKPEEWTQGCSFNGGIFSLPHPSFFFWDMLGEALMMNSWV